MLGRFVDVGWSYRFGPPAQDLLVASLGHSAGTDAPISPGHPPSPGRPVPESAADALGLDARASPSADGSLQLTLSTRRFLYGVRAHFPGYTPTEDAFSMEPETERTLVMRPDGATNRRDGWLTALNLQGRHQVPVR